MSLGVGVPISNLDWGGGVVPGPEAPSYGPYGVQGLEIGGGPMPRRLKCIQFDLIDWEPETQIPCITGDARNLPFPDETFGYVFSSNLIEHFSANETTAILTEWTRVLAIGGELELVTPDCMGILRDFFNHNDTWADTATRILGGNPNEFEHRTAFTLREFPGVIEQIPDLELMLCESSHQGGGIHAVAVKRRAK